MWRHKRLTQAIKGAKINPELRKGRL